MDSPKGAIVEADDLVSSVMKVRGYPVTDFDQRAADISVDHPRVVEHGRPTNCGSVREKKEQPRKRVRTAMIHYRSLLTR